MGGAVGGHVEPVLAVGQPAGRAVPEEEDVDRLARMAAEMEELDRDAGWPDPGRARVSEADLPVRVVVEPVEHVGARHGGRFPGTAGGTAGILDEGREPEVCGAGKGGGGERAGAAR